MTTTKQRPTETRLWEKVEKTSSCWEWTGAKDSTGYGKLRRSRTEVARVGGPVHWPAHRLAYELSIGSIPEGMDLDHKCRNRGCVNPSHLEPVPRRTNVLRGVGLTAINAQKTHCINGHEFDLENTRLKARKDGSTSRDCRKCDAIRISKKRSLTNQKAAA